MELAGPASPRSPESHVDSPAPPEKDICKDSLDHRITVKKSCIHKELDLGQKNSSSLHSSSDCENQAPNNDEMTGSESTLEIEGNGSSGEKVLKKPDKILPCPRCNSMDTKFCYYNNYNVKQPRHFCRKCQRYWTAGGSMRNIPVGAGKRKSKSSSANCRSILTPGSSIATPGGEASFSPLPINGNQAAVDLMLNIGGKESKNANPASTAQPNNVENQTSPPPSTTMPDTPLNESCKSSVAEHQNGISGHNNRVASMHHIPLFFPGPQFVYPWSPAWNGIPGMAATVCPSPAEAAACSENGNTGINVQWNVPPMVPVIPPGFCIPPIPIPVPVMPPSVQPFIAPWTDGAWSVPWLGPSSGVFSASSATINSTCLEDSGSPVPVLGKHPRDSKPGGGDDKAERCLWIPKTLRIDDPDEAAKSSIWTTLGIEPGERGMFRPFQSKTQIREQVSGGAARVLQANPAAVSRSRSFQEAT